MKKNTAPEVKVTVGDLIMAVDTIAQAVKTSSIHYLGYNSQF